MKNTNKLFTVLIISLSLLSLIACNPLQSFNLDSDQVVENAADITDFDLPEGYQPDFSVNVNGYRIAAFNPGDGISHIYFLQSENEVDEETLQKALDKLVPGTKDRESRMKVLETYAMVIRGEDTTVIINEGINSENVKYRQAMAAFPGKLGPAMIVISEPTSTWDQEKINVFLESIR
ncbi:MAG: hypothetical protein CVU39_17475 [Chloroflexi bacterium HGW-Chloroflexi-10]|nr:MAG: hypothetical protein CVU39_17475 [Chloroflexi bacterium HGW-Chloroflexi-10]